MITLDASALVKLVIEEKDSEAARKIYKRELEGRERILVPYLILPEALNTLWKYHTLRKELSDKEFESALVDIISIFNKVEKVPESGIARPASEFAHSTKSSVYDSTYIVISRINNAPLLTFDGTIIKRSRELKVGLALNPAT